MKIRTTQPKNNKYYTRIATNGLNGAVAGKPTISGANVLCNCVGFCNGRFAESQNDPELQGIYKPFKYQLTCNAENFIESAKKQGLKISATPTEGGIMVWQKGATLGGSDGAGHVAFVERVYDDGTILTSESGWNAFAFKTVRRNNANGRWSQASGYKFRGCIINPSVKSTVTKAPKLSVDGKGGACTVRAMQKFFGTPMDGIISGQSATMIKKYCPALTAVEYGKGGSACIKKLQKWVGVTQDGVIGVKTVKAWQKKLNVTADGVFSEKSMKAWQKYLNEHDKPTYPKATTTSTPATTPKITAKQGDIVAKAKSLVGSSSSATAAYKAALNKAYPNRKSWGKSARLGKSCDVFVGTVIRSLGIDKNYPRGLAEQFLYKPSGFTRKVYKGVTPYSVSKDGDVIIYAKNKVPTKSNRKSVKGHTCIRGNGVIYEANYPSKYPHVNKSVKSKLGTKRPYVVILRAK